LPGWSLNRRCSTRCCCDTSWIEEEFAVPSREQQNKRDTRLPWELCCKCWFELNRIQNLDFFWGATGLFRGIRTRWCFRKKNCSPRPFVGGIGGRLEQEENGGDVPAGAARLQQPLLLLPLSAGTLPSACQALQEDHLRYLPAATGMSNPALLLDSSRFWSQLYFCNWVCVVKILREFLVKTEFFGAI
jgi:hypothetical protein